MANDIRREVRNHGTRDLRTTTAQKNNGSTELRIHESMECSCTAAKPPKYGATSARKCGPGQENPAVEELI